MERRLLLVFALTFLVIIISQPFLKKYLPQAPPASPAQSQPQPSQAQAVAAPAAATAAPLNVAGKQATAEADTVIENEVYRITFTNRGAQVKSWVLKKYDNEQRKPLDLVHSVAAQKYGLPLGLWTYDETLRNKLNTALYVMDSKHPAGAENGREIFTAPTEISFEYADTDVAVRKTIRFNHSYAIDVQTSVTSKGTPVTAFLVWPAGFGDQATLASYTASQIERQSGSDVERLAIKKVSGGGTVPGPFDWAGVTDQYFAAVFLPNDPANTALVTLRNSLDVPKNWKDPKSETTKIDVLGAAVGTLGGPTSERVFVGPKSLQVLESVHVPTITGASQDLRALINFGFFHYIARPLFLWLKWTHEKIVPNWGWAIAIQTLIINLVLLPLRFSSMRSMLKMQRIQPQMKAIQAKYAKYSMRDPRKQEMNKELMELQRQAGVNPVGGCVPMLIQIPFLFAYYGMLGSAIDLRHASWLWIHDLSAPDPVYLLPVLFVASMFFSQRMTPQAGMDPAQQKMMTFMMPLMMGFISFNLASGLCLYWAEGNLIGIVQQAIMNRTGLGREMRELAAKRARKKDK